MERMRPACSFLRPAEKSSRKRTQRVDVDTPAKPTPVCGSRRNTSGGTPEAARMTRALQQTHPA
jgi:hypothetical protein